MVILEGFVTSHTLATATVSDPNNRRRPLPYLAALTLVLFAANIAFFLNRDMEDSYYPTTYATIYYPTDRPVISDWKEVEGGIEAVLSWNAPVEGWRILKEGAPYSENKGANPFFPTPVGDEAMHLYKAIPEPEGLFPPLEIEIRFLPEAFHTNRGLPRPDTYLIRTDVPTARFEEYPVNAWVDDYGYMDPKDLATTDDILQNQAGIRSDDTVTERLEKLMAHFRSKLGQKCRGTPPPDFRWKTPFQIYKEMDSGESQGWCTQHAQMFTYFANRAGLQARLIQGARLEGNEFVLTGHTWVEAWIPEQGRWAWVDPSYGLVYAKDKNGRFLNTVELSELRQHDAWDGVTARVYKDWGWPELDGEDGTFVNADFADVNGIVERQFVTSSIYKWRRPPNVEDIRYDYGMLFKNSTFFWGNLERYWFKPPLALANFPTDGARTYWIRHILLWGFVASLIATFAFAGLRRRSPIVKEPAHVL